jgi:hypothetical protein
MADTNNTTNALSRRSALALVGSGAVVAASTTALAITAAHAGPDAELIALAEQACGMQAEIRVRFPWNVLIQFHTAALAPAPRQRHPPIGMLPHILSEGHAGPRVLCATPTTRPSNLVFRPAVSYGSSLRPAKTGMPPNFSSVCRKPLRSHSHHTSDSSAPGPVMLQ